MIIKTINENQAAALAQALQAASLDSRWRIESFGSGVAIGDECSAYAYPSDNDGDEEFCIGLFAKSLAVLDSDFDLIHRAPDGWSHDSRPHDPGSIPSVDTCLLDLLAKALIDRGAEL